MSYRGAHSRIVPRVFAEDAGGYARPAKCVHCGEVIAKQTLAWGRLAFDPAELLRPVHRRCRDEYTRFVIGLSLGWDVVTPAL